MHGLRMISLSLKPDPSLMPPSSMLEPLFGSLCAGVITPLSAHREHPIAYSKIEEVLELVSCQSVTADIEQVLEKVRTQRARIQQLPARSQIPAVSTCTTNRLLSSFWSHLGWLAGRSQQASFAGIL